MAKWKSGSNYDFEILFKNIIHAFFRILCSKTAIEIWLLFVVFFFLKNSNLNKLQKIQLKHFLVLLFRLQIKQTDSLSQIRTNGKMASSQAHRRLVFLAKFVQTKNQLDENKTKIIEKLICLTLMSIPKIFHKQNPRILKHQT